MADWRDGVEYAPTRRPYGFATPRAEPLPEPPPTTHLADGHPVTPPDTFSAPAAPPLRDLSPRTDTGRDPHAAFDSASAGFTGASAWGIVTHHGPDGWSPTEPLGLSGDARSTRTDFAPPTGPPVVAALPGRPGPAPEGLPVNRLPAPAAYPAPGSYPPPAAYPPPGSYPPPAAYPPPGSYPPTASEQATRPGSSAMTWLLVLLLLGGAVMQSLSILFLIGGGVVVRLVRPRRPMLVTVISVGAGIVFPVLAFLAVIAEPYDILGAVSPMSQIVCFALAVVATITLAIGGSRR